MSFPPPDKHAPHCLKRQVIFPQIPIAIGVLTSNWRIGRGTRVPLQGAVDVVPLLAAIVGCHSSVLWWGEGG